MTNTTAVKIEKIEKSPKSQSDNKESVPCNSESQLCHSEQALCHSEQALCHSELDSESQHGNEKNDDVATNLRGDTGSESGMTYKSKSGMTYKSKSGMTGKQESENVKKINKSLFEITLADSRKLSAEKVLIATGGQFTSNPEQTEVYSLAKQLGHTIKPLARSLGAFVTKEKWTADVSGLSFKRAKLILKGKKKYEFNGPFMFTHKGLTGPAIFSLSSMAAYEKITHNTPLTLRIDFLPEIGYDKLELLIKAERESHPKAAFRGQVAKYVPKSFAALILQNAGCPEATKNNEVSKKVVAKIIETLKNTQLTIVSTFAYGEFVTAGGVNTKEVTNTTMESKLCPNLYFAGEILDIDAFTGGFNLQAAWSTGHAAAIGILKNT